MSERLPAPDSGRVRDARPQDDEVLVIALHTAVLRIHTLGGAHPAAWDEFRAWGPTSARFDHHPPPVRSHPRRRIAYAAVGDEAFTTAIGEFFQDESGGVAPIDRVTRTPAASAFELTRPVTLLDLGSGWVTRAGGNQAIMSGPRSSARDWARVIYRHHHGLDGLAYRSSVWGPGTCLALWERAQSSLPATVVLHRSLADPVLDVPLAHAAERLGTVVLP